MSKGALAVGLFAAGLVWGGGMGGEKRWGESSTGFLAPLGGEDPRIVLRQGLGADKQLDAVRELVARQWPGTGELFLDLLGGGYHLETAVEVAVIQGLGRLRHRPALPYLLRRLRVGRSSRVRGACLEAIGRIWGRRSLPVLIKALQTSDFIKPAFRALVGLGGQVRGDLLEILREGSQSAEEVAVILGFIGGKEVFPAVLAAWRRREINSSAFINALGPMKDPRAPRWLCRFLLHDVKELSEDAFSALKVRREKLAAPCVLVALGAGRLSAQQALEFMRAVDYRKGLTIGLTYSKKQDPIVRYQALDLAAKSGGIQPLARLLDPRQRTFFRELLGVLGFSRRPGALKPLIRQTRWRGELGVAAVHSLGNLLSRRGRRLLGSAKRRRATVAAGVAALASIAKRHETKKWAALKALARIGELDTEQLEMKKLHQLPQAARLRRCAVLASLPKKSEYFPTFRRLLDWDGSESVQVCAAWALRGAQDLRSLELLKGALTRVSEPVACTASASLALSAVKNQRAWRALQPHLESPSECLRRNAVWAAGWRKEARYQRELRYLMQRSKDPEVRRNAIRGLWRQQEGAEVRSLLMSRLSKSENDPGVLELIRQLLWERGSLTKRGLGPRGQEVFSVWVRDGEHKAAGRLYRAVLPRGLQLWGVVDSHGYITLDDLYRGEVDIKVEVKTEKRKKAAKPKDMKRKKSVAP